jgi:hypothetical protein
VSDDAVHIEHLVVRVPASALDGGAGDEPARRYAREVAGALASEMAAAPASAQVGRMRVRIADGTDPAHVAHRIVGAIPRSVDGAQR